MTAGVFLLSDDLGGQDNSYDRIFGNLVRGRVRVNFLFESDGWSPQVHRHVAESYEHDWRVLSYFEPEFV